MAGAGIEGGGIEGAVCLLLVVCTGSSYSFGGTPWDGDGVLGGGGAATEGGGRGEEGWR